MADNVDGSSLETPRSSSRGCLHTIGVLGLGFSLLLSQAGLIQAHCAGLQTLLCHAHTSGTGVEHARAPQGMPQGRDVAYILELDLTLVDDLTRTC